MLNDLFLVALLAHDWRATRRLHPATLAGALTIIAMQAVNNSPLPSHPAVQQVVRWVIS